MLDALSTPALVTLYNKLAADHSTDEVKAVTRFSDRATAVKRVEALLTKCGMKVAVVVDGVPTLVHEATGTDPETGAAEQEAVNAAVAAPAPAKAERKRRGFRFVFPARDEIKGHREGTNRAKLVEMMSRPATAERGAGATFEELRAATGWDEKTCYEGTRLVHYYLGYGMRQDADGRITLFR